MFRYCTFVNTMRKIPGWAVTKKETKSELVNVRRFYVQLEPFMMEK